MGQIYLGTSGYSYREWIGSFYPRGLKGPELLAYYASHFNAVELNNTFYQLPAAATLESWRNSVGPEFRFAVKASQLITHRKDFGMESGQFNAFLSGIALLGAKLGPVLFQFPPALGNPERLLAFIRQMKESVPDPLPLIPVIELRHKNLLQDSFFETLRGYQFHLCFNDAFLKPEEWPEPLAAVYLRLRNSPYSSDYLQRIAARLKKWTNQGKDCYVFFKHEEGAPELAQRMLAVLHQAAG